MSKITAIYNKNLNVPLARKSSLVSYLEIEKIAEFHQSIGNIVTPITELPNLAKSLGIKTLFIKDESYRLGLNAFKGLGASYAMTKQLEKNSNIETFCTATDGNHGKAVAWMARKLEKKAVIYMPKGTAEDRVRAIEKEGAKVYIIDGGYDIAVKMAYEKVNNDKNKNSWCLIQDTAWEGYKEIPIDITKGYLTQMREISEQIENEKIDFMFLQSGVGSWASSILMYAFNFWKTPPLFISVEPHSANCLYKSIDLGKRVSINNSDTTAMAGLDCGTLSTEAWKILKYGLFASISISESLMEEAVRSLAFPLGGDLSIKSGESGASSLGALIGLLRSSGLGTFKEKIGLNKESNILLINTEGNTDRVNYQKILNEK